MMFKAKDKLLIGGGFVLALLLVVIGLFFPPKVVRQEGVLPTFETIKAAPAEVELVEPLVKQKGLSVVPQILVDFSSSVLNKAIELKSSPSAKFTAVLNSEGTTVVFSPTSVLDKNIKYSFQVIVENRSVFSWSASTGNKGTTQKNLALVVNKIRNKLPLNERDFGISYDGATDQFFVFIEKAPIDDTKKEANQWLRDQGLKDFKALNINYTAFGSLLRQ